MSEPVLKLLYVHNMGLHLKQKMQKLNTARFISETVAFFWLCIVFYSLQWSSDVHSSSCSPGM